MLLYALVLLPITAVALRWVGFRRVHSALAWLGPFPASQTGSDDEVSGRVSRATSVIRSASWHAPHIARCLPASLVLWWLLRRQGIDSGLRVGVRRRDGRFEAHAWVEYRGRPLNHRGDVGQEYAPFSQVITPHAANPQ